METQNNRISNLLFACFVFIIFFALPSSLLHNFLAYNHYSPFSPESLIIFVAIACLSLGSAGVAVIWRAGGVFLVALIVLFYIYAVVNIDQVYAWIGNATVQTIVKFGFAAAALIIIFLLIRRMGATAWRGLALAAAVILASTSITWWIAAPLPRVRKMVQPSETDRSNLPPFLYIIFDEHMSVKWTPATPPSAQATRQRMLDFYQKFGFLLFTNAFSHYFNSAPSITNALNFSAEPSPVGLDKTQKGRKLVDNQVFNALNRMGYRIRVYQNQYLDFCNAADEGIEFCIEFGQNYIGDIQGTPIPTGHKSLLILGHWLKSFRFGKRITEATQKRLAASIGKDLLRIPIVGSPYNKVAPLNAMRALERLRTDVSRFPRGTAFFAHVLIPHYPYMFDDRCDLKKDPRTWLGPNTWYDNQNPPPRVEQYRHYYAQVRCLYRWLESWFDELADNGLLKDMVVIFHGDHGSRICQENPSVKTLSHPDWNRIAKDGFSTLFAVKNPKIAPGRVAVAKPINTLIEESFNDPQGLRKTKPGEGFVYLKSKGKRLQPYPYNP